MVADRMALRRTVAVINGKGGVGKTSLVANLGGLLAAADYRVLLIDLDPQGNLGEDLGYTGAELGDDGAGLFQSVMSGQPLQPMPQVRKGLDVVPGGDHLHDLAATLYARRQRDSTGRAASSLADSLAPIAHQYDLVLLDCPPGQDALQEAALAAARWVLIPTKSDASSRRGLHEVGRRYTAARAINPDLDLLGVVLFGVTTRARRVVASAREQIEAELGGVAPVLDSTIRHVEAAAVDARNRGQLVHELERDMLTQQPWYTRFRGNGGVESNGGKHAAAPLAGSAGPLAGDYQRLAEELLGRLTEAEAQARGGAA